MYRCAVYLGGLYSIHLSTPDLILAHESPSADLPLFAVLDTCSPMSLFPFIDLVSVGNVETVLSSKFSQFESGSIYAVLHLSP